MPRDDARFECWNGHDVRRFGEDPGDGRASTFDAPRPQAPIRAQYGAGFAAIRGPESAGWRREVARVKSLDVLQQAAEKASPERREGDERRIALLARLNEPELRIASPKEIFRLNCRARMDRVRAPQGVGRDFAQADGADRSGFDATGQLPDRVLDWNALVDAMDLVEVDVTDAKASLRTLARLPPTHRRVVPP